MDEEAFRLLGQLTRSMNDVNKAAKYKRRGDREVSERMRLGRVRSGLHIVRVLLKAAEGHLTELVSEMVP
jgi:hypothetical protein